MLFTFSSDYTFIVKMILLLKKLKQKGSTVSIMSVDILNCLKDSEI